MESRNIVLMNLFAGQQWRCRTDLWTHGGKERVGRIGGVALKHTLPYVKQIASGNLLYDAGS